MKGTIRSVECLTLAFQREVIETMQSAICFCYISSNNPIQH